MHGKTNKRFCYALNLTFTFTTLWHTWNSHFQIIISRVIHLLRTNSKNGSNVMWYIITEYMPFWNTFYVLLFYSVLYLNVNTRHVWCMYVVPLHLPLKWSTYALTHVSFQLLLCQHVLRSLHGFPLLPFMNTCFKNLLCNQKNNSAFRRLQHVFIENSLMFRREQFS